MSAATGSGRGGVRRRKTPPRSRSLAPHEIKSILGWLLQPPPIKDADVLDHAYHPDGSLASSDGPFHGRFSEPGSRAYQLLPEICATPAPCGSPVP